MGGVAEFFLFLVNMVDCSVKLVVLVPSDIVQRVGGGVGGSLVEATDGRAQSGC